MFLLQFSFFQEHEKMKTSELTGSSLDWMVANIEDVGCLYWAGEERKKQTFAEWKENGIGYSPSTNWAQAGPIIEKEKIGILFYVDHIPDDADEPIWVASCGGERALGHTPLIAAMRCYVLLELGKDVEIPEELI